MRAGLVKIEVVYDGIRAYRVPSIEEIQALLLVANGMTTPEASAKLGMSHKEGAQRRINEAMWKLHACSGAQALYQLYRLQIVPAPFRYDLNPVLDDHQLHILEVVARLGLAYDTAAPQVGIDRKTLVKRMRQIHELLGSSNRVQAYREAICRRDVPIVWPTAYWRGDT